MRRKFCFEVNAARLASLGRLHLWTFTRVEVPEDLTDIREAWRKLLIYLRRKLPNWSGIRTYELHPGRWREFSHGLHVHVICNLRYDVHKVREAAKAAGWGRIHVRRCGSNAWRYVSKYLWKPRPAALKGWRLWSCFNLPDRSRLRDVVIDSVRARLFSIGPVRYPQVWKNLKWGEKLRTIAQWHREVIETGSFYRLSHPVLLSNRCAEYDQRTRREPWVGDFEFVGMGAKQAQFQFHKDLPSDASAGTRSGSGYGPGARITGGQPLTQRRRVKLSITKTNAA